MWMPKRIKVRTAEDCKVDIQSRPWTHLGNLQGHHVNIAILDRSDDGSWVLREIIKRKVALLTRGEAVRLAIRKVWPNDDAVLDAIEEEVISQQC